MTGYHVVFSPEALRNLDELFNFIADAGSPDNAELYVDAIVTFCEGLAQFPIRGTARDDIRPGLRTLGYKKRAIIAFAFLEKTVTIVGVFYGGRDYETILTPKHGKSDFNGDRV